MLINMFVHENMIRKLLLPNSSLWEIPVFHLTGRAGGAAGLDMHHTVDEYGDGRKEGSIPINLSIIQPMPLINFCNCSVYCVFPAFTRESFWFKAIFEVFLCH